MHNARFGALLSVFVLVLTAMVAVPSTAGAQVVPPSVVITELHYHPVTDPDPANAIDDLEFIELHNPGTSALLLNGMSFADGVTGSLNGVLIPAGGFVVISPDSAATVAAWGVTPAATYTGKLSNGGELLQIVAADGVTVVDEVTYSDDPPWPASPDGAGPSLELIDPAQDNDAVTNWTASVGGPTPGATNSAFSSTPAAAITNIVAAPARPFPGQSVSISADAAGAAALNLVYQVGFDSPVTIPMVPTAGTTLVATVPAQAAGELVRYRIEDPNSTTSAPSAADSIDQFGFVVRNAAATTAGAPIFEWFIDPADYANMLSNHLLDDMEFDAVVAYDGTVWDGVRVRFRGSDYSRQNFAKKSFNFEFPSGHDFEAPGLLDYPVDEFALQAEPADHTFGRADAGWNLYEAAGFPKVHSFGVRLEQNGSFFGVYRFQEKLDGTWRDAVGLDSGSFYKANEGGFANTTGFDKKEPSDNDYSEVLAVRPWLSQGPNAAKATYFWDNWDIPNTVNYFAVATLLGHDDSWWHNYYVWRDLDGTERWRHYPWDLDVTFGLDVANTPCAGTAMTDLLCTGGSVARAFHEIPGFEEMLRRRQAQLLAGPFSQSTVEAAHAAHVNALGVDAIDREADVWRNNWPDFADRIPQFNAQAGVRRSSIAGASGLPTPQPSTPPIVINEISYNPTNDDAEFIELYNPSASMAVDLSGWTLDGTGLTFPGGTVLLPQAYLVAADNDLAFRTLHPGLDVLMLQYPGGLSGGGEQIDLLNASGTVVDSVTYDDAAPWPTSPDAGQATLSLITPASDNAVAASWDVSATSAGTPGAANDTASTPPTTPTPPTPPTTPQPTPPTGGGGGTIDVIAKGDSGIENAIVLVDGIQVGSFTPTTTMATYSFPATITANSVVRVEFVNDAPGRNITVDAIEANGTRYESEAATTYSVGVWTPGTGCAGGFKQSERLACNGYLEYNVNGTTSGGASTPPTTPNPPAGGGGSGTLRVIAEGDLGGEIANVLVNGVQVGTFTATTTLTTYTFTAALPAGAVVRVEFVNDGSGLNLTVDAIEANGTRYESEAPTTASLGVWTPGSGCAAGFKQREKIACNGYLEFTL